MEKIAKVQNVYYKKTQSSECGIPDFSKELYDFNRDGPRCINYFPYNGYFYICLRSLPLDETKIAAEKCIADLFKIAFDNGITRLEIDIESFKSDWEQVKILLNKYKNYYSSIKTNL